jgi:hypothetical protein
VAEIVQGDRRKVTEESVKDKIHSDHSEDVPPPCAKYRVQISKGKSRKQKGDSRSAPKKQEYAFSRRYADPAKPTDKH